VSRRQTWRAIFRHTSARHLPRPFSFTVHAYLERPRPEPHREITIELTRDEAVKVHKHLDSFLWRTDPAGVWANYPDGWQGCACGFPVLDGHLTCGRAECGGAAPRPLRLSAAPAADLPESPARDRALERWRRSP
jgi:hypothetical protein